MNRILIMYACLYGIVVFADERYVTHRLPDKPTELDADDFQELDTSLQDTYPALGADDNHEQGSKTPSEQALGADDDHEQGFNTPSEQALGADVDHEQGFTTSSEQAFEVDDDHKQGFTTSSEQALGANDDHEQGSNTPSEQALGADDDHEQGFTSSSEQALGAGDDHEQGFTSSSGQALGADDDHEQDFNAPSEQALGADDDHEQGFNTSIEQPDLGDDDDHEQGFNTPSEQALGADDDHEHGFNTLREQALGADDDHEHGFNTLREQALRADDGHEQGIYIPSEIAIVADYLPGTTDNAPRALGTDRSHQGLLALNKAVEVFEADFIRVLLGVWVKSDISGKDFKINFSKLSLKGSITFSQVLFVIDSNLKPRESPSFSLTPNGLKITYKLEISLSMFHSLYHVNVTSIDEKQMKGVFDAGFVGLNMDAKLIVTKGQGGACQYEVRFDISTVPKSYTAKSNVISGFRDSNLSKKIESIVNTFLRNGLLQNKDLAILYKFSQQLKQGVDKKVGEKFREVINKDLCDFM